MKIPASAMKWDMVLRRFQRMVRSALQACLLLAAVEASGREGEEAGDARSTAAEVCRGKSLEDLVAMMGDDRFFIRESAQEELSKRMFQSPPDEPNPVEEACYSHYLGNPDPEIRMRTKEILMDLATNHWSPRGYLGVASEQESSFDQAGKMLSQVRVTKVDAKGPAARAGILPDDLIFSVDDLTFDEGKAKDQFAAYLSELAPGDPVVLKISRKSKELEIKVVLATRARPKEFDEDRNEIAPDPEKCLIEYLQFRKRRGSE